MSPTIVNAVDMVASQTFDSNTLVCCAREGAATGVYEYHMNECQLSTLTLWSNTQV